MLLSRIYPTLVVLLLLSASLESECSLILGILLKIMFLKGALFLGTPMAIGSFILGQGLGFLGGGLVGGWSVLKSAHKYHDKEKAAWKGGYGAGYGLGLHLRPHAHRLKYKINRHPHAHTLKKPVYYRPHAHAHAAPLRPIIQNYGPPQHAHSTSNSYGAPPPPVYGAPPTGGGYGYSHNTGGPFRRREPPPLQSHRQFSSPSANQGVRYARPPPPSPRTPSPQATTFARARPKYAPVPTPLRATQTPALADDYLGDEGPVMEDDGGGEELYEEYSYPEQPSSQPPSVLQQLLALPSLMADLRVASKYGGYEGYQQQRRHGQGNVEQAPAPDPAPVSTLVHYIESQLEQKASTASPGDEGKKVEAKNLIRLLKSAYLAELEKSMEAEMDAPVDAFKPLPPEYTSGASNQTGTREGQRPKRENKPQEIPPAEQVLQHQQALQQLQAEINQFFTVLSLLDQDTCLQKLVCDVHTRLATQLSEYEANIVVTFRVLNLISPPTDGGAGGAGATTSDDPTAKFRLASLVGQLGGDPRICDQAYSGCVHRVQEIIEMGGRVGGVGNAGDHSQSGSDRQEVTATPNPTFSGVVTMPRV